MGKERNRYFRPPVTDPEELKRKEDKAVAALCTPEFSADLTEKIRERLEPIEKLRRDSWSRALKKSLLIR